MKNAKWSKTKAPETKRLSLFKTVNIHDKLLFSWQDSLKSVFILAVCILLSELLRLLHIGNENVILIYLLSVLLISRMTDGYAYGVLASFFNLFIYDFLINEPRFGFSISKHTSITFLIMFTVSIIISALTNQFKKQVLIANEKEYRTSVLNEFSRELISAGSVKQIVALSNTYISDVTSRSVLFYLGEIKEGSPRYLQTAPKDNHVEYLFSEKEVMAAKYSLQRRMNAGVGTDLCSESEALYIPVVSKDMVFGLLCISCREGYILNENGIAFLGLLASQIALTLHLHSLSEEKNKILIESEKEKMRSNLLRAVSHDLRTPLTGIWGASSVLLEQEETMAREARVRLLTDIREDSNWLIRMVENLLSVTRINEDMKVKKEPEAVEEIIAGAVSRFKKHFADRKLFVKIPDQLLLVPMDGTLIIQVLLNLLENAVKNSAPDSQIELIVRTEGEFAVFEVRDQGSGIREDYLPDLFIKQIPSGTVKSDSSKGMGVGLSICLSVINAHEGKIEAENRPEEGAIIRFYLPLH